MKIINRLRQASNKMDNFLEKTVCLIIMYIATTDMKNSFFIATNIKEFQKKRIIASIRGGSCFITVITAFLSRMKGSIRLQAGLRLCSAFFNLVYTLCQGNTVIIIVINTYITKAIKNW